MPPGVIDTYLTKLNAALKGPNRAKADLLAEARDSLEDAAEAYEHQGLPRHAAEQAAIADFGELPEIVPGYQAELGWTQGYRTALAVLSMFAAQPLVWGYAFEWATGTSSDQPYTADEIVENTGGITILMALLGVLAYRFGMRHPAVRARLTRITGIGALAACALLVSMSTMMTALAGNAVSLLWTTMFVLLPVTWITTSARRCLTR